MSPDTLVTPELPFVTPDLSFVTPDLIGRLFLSAGERLPVKPAMIERLAYSSEARSLTPSSIRERSRKEKLRRIVLRWLPSE